MGSKLSGLLIAVVSGVVTFVGLYIGFVVYAPPQETVKDIASNTKSSEKATPEPSTETEPEPKKVEPEPKKVEPEPKKVEPEPKKVEPEPKKVEPEPKKIDPEPKKTDPKKAEPEPKKIDPEPKKTDPKKTEPEPKKTEPKKTEPEPKKVEPEPKKIDPEPKKTDPKKVEPEPKKIDPEPKKTDPKKTEPEPKKTEPKKTEPEPKKSRLPLDPKGGFATNDCRPQDFYPIPGVWSNLPRNQYIALYLGVNPDDASLKVVFAELKNLADDPAKVKIEQAKIDGKQWVWLYPVADLKAFAKRVEFGKVLDVNTNERGITIHPYKMRSSP